MSKPIHATEIAKTIDQVPQAAMVVLFGDEAHLKTSVMAKLCEEYLGTSLEDAMGLIRLTGKEVDFRTVRDEVQTVSMFTPSKVVLVENANEFVSAYRAKLESFVDHPVGKSKLVLDVTKWPGNTKLAKKVAQKGLAIECSELTGGRLISWLSKQAQAVYQKKLSREAAHLIPELAGTGMGLLDQELQNLSSYVGDRPEIQVEDVRTLVGGWKSETTWTMIHAIRDGQVDVALNCLQKLLYAGEAAPKILGGINYVFRKIAQATELSRQGRPLAAALKEAGVFYKEIESTERYLRRIRRPRAERILHRLAEADSHLKGGSRLSEKLQMEQLILWLSGHSEL